MHQELDSSDIFGFLAAERVKATLAVLLFVVCVLGPGCICVCICEVRLAISS